MGVQGQDILAYVRVNEKEERWSGFGGSEFSLRRKVAKGFEKVIYLCVYYNFPYYE